MFKKKRKKKDTAEIEIENLVKNKRIKTMIDLKKNECNSIKSIIAKGDTNIEVSLRFIKGKMLMFAKLSFKSFVYDMIDVFCFPNEEIQKFMIIINLENASFIKI